jgi:phage protein D
MTAPAAPQAQPIYVGQDFYVPVFELRPPGGRLPKDVLHDVLSVTYSDDITKIDSFELVVNNWDADTRTFKYSDGSTFLPGRKLELWMGYRGRNPLQRVMTGEITALRPTFPSGGPPTLAVSALNVLHRFRGKQHTEAYTQKTDSQVAQLIAARLGVRVQVHPKDELRHPYLLQDNKYDIVFLMERARQVGYELWVDEDQRTGESTLHFEPSENLRRITYQLTWGKSLIEFQPTLTTAHQVGQVTVRAWDRKQKKMITGKATRAQLGGKRDEEVESTFNEREEVVTAVVADQREANRLAAERLKDISHEMVKGSGSTLGLPDLRAGRRVVIDRLGSRFDGTYFVTATKHTFGDSGYLTSFDCRRED